jgi:hypothetical protein
VFSLPKIVRNEIPSFFSSENGSERNSEVFSSKNGLERNSKVLSFENCLERNSKGFSLPRNGLERNSEVFLFRETGGIPARNNFFVGKWQSYPEPSSRWQGHNDRPTPNHVLTQKLSAHAC